MEYGKDGKKDGRKGVRQEGMDACREGHEAIVKCETLKRETNEKTGCATVRPSSTCRNI